MEKNRIAYEIITLDHNIRRFLINEGKCTPIKNMPSQVQMRIVHYLIQNKDTDIYQRDLEKVLNLRRSTISGILKTMEKHNIIIRTDSKIDARSKKIELSSTSLKFYNESRKVFEKVNTMLTKDIDTDDLEIFFKVAKKMKENLNEEKEEKLC